MLLVSIMESIPLELLAMTYKIFTDSRILQYEAETEAET